MTVPTEGREVAHDMLTEGKVLHRVPRGPTEQRRDTRRSGRHVMEEYGLFVDRRPKIR